MARKPKKVKLGADPVRISCLLEADIVAKIDAVAVELTKADPYRRVSTRTDALRALVLDGLKSRTK